MNLFNFNERNSVLLRTLLPYVKEHKRKLAVAAIAMAVLAAIRGVIVYILGPVVKGVFIDKNAAILNLLFIGLPVLFTIRLAVEYISNYYMNYIGQRVIHRIREDFFVHIHNLSMEFYWRKRSADVMSRVINDLNNIQSTVQFIPLYGIRDLMTVFALTFVLFYLSWKLALISITILPVTSYILGILGRKMRKSSRESQTIVADISHKFQESLQGMAIVKAFNYEEHAIKKFGRTNQDYFDRIMRYLRATSIAGPIMEFIGSMILVLLLMIGSNAIFSGRITTEMFLSFMAAFFTAYMPIKNISNLNAKLQMGLASWDRIYQILEEKPAVTVTKSAVKIKKLDGKIEFRNVSYKYPTGEDFVLKDVSFTINPNEISAFVGPSGCGKSTIIQLILRFFDPVKGDILIDGINLRELDIKSLREHMSIVTQDTVLFDDTVKNNIRMGKMEASDQEVTGAAEASDAHDFIKSMPGGYETMIGERGIKVSGGQRQRLAIARAIIKKPKVLLLDEATSNLDTRSEQAVQKAIENVLTDKTVVMVAHRLSTVRNCDKIFVLKDGRIQESGDHDELRLLSGEYEKLYKAQN
ncbi:MAG: hypothetical protein COT17_01340 [Elusimicrobia bacterium CG08_land_8_20_14_0_20_51_18]|nr:MAG: hypothetical protein COT17_01340 [Elusimicrobia bacterium CG08_land_8_20_14_0_20_51_18]